MTEIRDSSDYQCKSSGLTAYRPCLLLNLTSKVISCENINLKESESKRRFFFNIHILPNRIESVLHRPLVYNHG